MWCKLGTIYFIDGLNNVAYLNNAAYLIEQKQENQNKEQYRTIAFRPASAKNSNTTAVIEQ